MAKINRYDTPAESNYFNTFVPLPLDQITALGMKRQEDLQRRQDTFSKSVDDASMIDYVPGSVDEGRVRNEFLPQIQQLAEEAMSIDLSNPVEWAKYSTKIKRLSVSDDIKRIEQSAAGYRQNLAIASEQKAKGVYNPLLDDTLKRVQSLDSRNEIFNYVPESQIDKSKLFEPYYKDIGQDYSYRANAGTKDNPLWVLRQGISDNKIRNIGSKAAQDLAGTSHGQQIIRLARAENPGLYSEMSDRQIIESQMYEYGKSRTDFRDQVLSDNMQGAGKKEDETLFDIIPVSTGGKAWDIDPAGVGKEFSIIYGATPLAAAGTYAQAGAGMATMGIPRDLPEGLAAAMGENRTSNINSAYKKIIDKYPVFAKGPDGKDITPEETIANYKSAVEEWQNTSSTVYSFGNEQVNNEWNKQVARTLSHREIILPGNDTPVSVEKAAKHYGYTYDEFIKALANENDLSVHVNAPSIGARGAGWSDMQIIPRNRKGASRESILISSSKDETAYFKDYYKLQNSVKSNESIPVILDESNDGSGRKIVAIPIKNMGYNAAGKPSLEITIAEFMVDKDGKPIGGPIDVNKTLNDYYNEAASNMIKGKHFDKDTKGLKSEY